MKRAVLIIRDSEVIALLADLERGEILRLLSNGSMTETMLSQHIGLTKAAVGYHLQLLLGARLIELERSELEAHGILQKYYSTVASVFVIDPAKIPREVRRHFVRVQMQRLRGVLSAPLIMGRAKKVELTLPLLEELAEAMLQPIYQAAENYQHQPARRSPETFEVALYAEAFLRLLGDPKWSGRLRRLLNLERRIS